MDPSPKPASFTFRGEGYSQFVPAVNDHSRGDRYFDLTHIKDAEFTALRWNENEPGVVATFKAPVQDYYCFRITGVYIDYPIHKQT